MGHRHKNILEYSTNSQTKEKLMKKKEYTQKVKKNTQIKIKKSEQQFKTTGVFIDSSVI